MGALSVVVAIRFILAGVWSHENSLLVAVAESVPDSAVRDRINQFSCSDASSVRGFASQFGASWMGGGHRAVSFVLCPVYCGEAFIGGLSAGD